MSELAIRGEVVDQSLDQLAATIRDGHAEVKRQLQRTLAQALEVGDALLRAKELIPEGRWTEWLEAQCDLTTSVGGYYMRLAFYRDALPNGLTQVEAVEYLRGFPPISGRAVHVVSHPQDVKAEAIRRRKEGQRYQEISDALGIRIGTIQRWCKPKKDKTKLRREAQTRRKKAKREEIRRITEREARKIGGSVAKSYSLLRLLAQELDRASASDELELEARKELRQALAQANRVEAHICRALGVDYGAWRSVR